MALQEPLRSICTMSLIPSMLRILNYYRLSKSALIPEISDRLSKVFETGDSWAVDIDPPTDVDGFVRLRYSPSPKQALPNQVHYEKLFSMSFERLQVRLGEREPMRLLGEDWYVLGHTIFFANDSPSDLEIQAALKTWIRQQKG